MFCPSCGAEIPDDAAFCEHCGEKLGAAKKPTPEPEPTLKEETEKSPVKVESQGSSEAFMPRDVPIEGWKWITEAWEIFKADIVQLIVLYLIFSIACGVLSITIIGLLAVPGIYAGYLIVMIGYLRRKEKLDIGKMFQCGWDYFVDMLLYGLIGGIIAGIATIFLIIPGMMVSLAFGLTAFLIVDKKVKFGDAMNSAFALLSKQIGGLFMFSLIIIGICIVIGLLSIIPILGWIIYIAFALVISPVLVIAYFIGYEKIYGDG